MHNSEKSIPFVNLINLSLKLIVKFASRLEPISLDALLSSMLLLQVSLIFISSIHLLDKLLLYHLDGISENFSRCILLLVSVFINE